MYVLLWDRPEIQDAINYYTFLLDVDRQSKGTTLNAEISLNMLR